MTYLFSHYLNNKFHIVDLSVAIKIYLHNLFNLYYKYWKYTLNF